MLVYWPQEGRKKKTITIANAPALEVFWFYRSRKFIRSKQNLYLFALFASGVLSEAVTVESFLFQSLTDKLRDKIKSYSWIKKQYQIRLCGSFNRGDMAWMFLDKIKRMRDKTQNRERHDDVETHTSKCCLTQQTFYWPIQILQARCMTNVKHFSLEQHSNQPSDFRVMVGVRGNTYQPITAL